MHRMNQAQIRCCAQWKANWSLILLKIFVTIWFLMPGTIVSATQVPNCDIHTPECSIEYRNHIKKMFFHAYDSYIDFAFPADELKPISCKGRFRAANRDEGRGHIDDVLGNYSLTLIDSLDTLFVMGEIEKFEEGIALILAHVNFNQNISISVFESTIRVLGGLLSIHSITQHFSDQLSRKYGNEVLNLAEDLGRRLLLAFQSPTGIPYTRVNLQSGVEYNVVSKVCSVAEAGSLVLEFGILSHFTKDPIFMESAMNAIQGIYKRRSNLNLVGELIDVTTGKWISGHAGIGSGLDSFYEYLLKAYVLFGDEQFLEMFESFYLAANSYLKRGHHYYQADMNTGKIVRDHASSLQAFWPGLQVMYGDLRPAILYYTQFYRIVQNIKFLPELWILGTAQISVASYPLRPEFVESTYYLFRATADPIYLKIGTELVHSLEKFTKTDCAYAAFDLHTGVKEDRMDSFFLAETLKYLYLLFDNENLFNYLHSEWVFTTEAHMLPLTHRGFEPDECSVSLPSIYEYDMQIALPPAPLTENLKRVGAWSFYLENLEIVMVPQTHVLTTLRVLGSGLASLDYSVLPARFGGVLNTTGVEGKLIFGSPFDGCKESSKNNFNGNIAVFKRGNCLFFDKYRTAVRAGASAVIIINSNDQPLSMTATREEVVASSIGPPIVLITRSEGEYLQRHYQDETVALFSLQEYVLTSTEQIWVYNHMKPQQNVLFLTYPELSYENITHWVLNQMRFLQIDNESSPIDKDDEKNGLGNPSKSEALNPTTEINHISHTGAPSPPKETQPEHKIQEKRNEINQLSQFDDTQKYPQALDSLLANSAERQETDLEEDGDSDDDNENEENEEL